MLYISLFATALLDKNIGRLDMILTKYGGSQRRVSLVNFCFIAAVERRCPVPTKITFFKLRITAFSFKPCTIENEQSCLFFAWRRFRPFEVTISELVVTTCVCATVFSLPRYQFIARMYRGVHLCNRNIGCAEQTARFLILFPKIHRFADQTIARNFSRCIIGLKFREIWSVGRRTQ